jgi:hypothetical protein
VVGSTYTACESLLLECHEHVSVSLGHHDAEQSLRLFLMEEMGGKAGSRGGGERIGRG